MNINQACLSSNTLKSIQTVTNLHTFFSKFIFFNESFRILIQMSLKFVPRAPINNKSVLVQPWRRTTSHYLNQSWPSSLTHICVTGIQYVQASPRHCFRAAVKFQSETYNQNLIRIHSLMGYCYNLIPVSRLPQFESSSDMNNLVFWNSHELTKTIHLSSIGHQSDIFWWDPALPYGIETLRHMMTSSNGNIFRVTGHLCGEYTGPRWIPRTMASDAELWCFLWSASE